MIARTWCDQKYLAGTLFVCYYYLNIYKHGCPQCSKQPVLASTSRKNYTFCISCSRRRVPFNEFYL